MDRQSEAAVIANCKFASGGAQHFAAVFDPVKWRAALSHMPMKRAGVRLSSHPLIASLLSHEIAIRSIVERYIGSGAKPVRAIYFNKTKANNWALSWHQDRTIMVKDRVNDVDGFGVWTRKQGLWHVEPPFALLEKMVTVRMHLDHVTMDNGALKIALGSHKAGKITEDRYDEVIAKSEQAVCPADAGDIWLYATPILHASDASHSLAPRRVIQLDYSADNLPAPLEWLGL